MKFAILAFLVGLVSATSLPSRGEPVRNLRGGSPVAVKVASPVVQPASPVPTTIANCNNPQDSCTSADVEFKCSGSRCWCNNTTEGEAVCFNSFADCWTYTSCNTSADCKSNQKCFNVTSCGCPGLTKACSDVKAAVNGSCSF
ncbi:hypothetical protein GQ53DRAFT_826179 [Thozetella sp. PMI_491]|nr:hypothetical protein GQ53DRAFT_826179 [Thozetella sp. PMI_491]